MKKKNKKKGIVKGNHHVTAQQQYALNQHFEILSLANPQFVIAKEKTVITEKFQLWEKFWN